MADVAEHRLFADTVMKANPETIHSTGVVPSQGLRDAVERGEIKSTEPVSEEQIQPASVDLRLGPVAARAAAPALLTGRAEFIAQGTVQLHVESRKAGYPRCHSGAGPASGTPYTACSRQ